MAESLLNRKYQMLVSWLLYYSLDANRWYIVYFLVKRGRILRRRLGGPSMLTVYNFLP